VIALLPDCLHACSYRLVAVAVGDGHCLALSSERFVFSWGNNAHGELGQGDTAFLEQPTIITGLTGKSVVHIAAGGNCSAFASENGLLQTCGRGEFGALGHGDKADQVTPHAAAGPCVVGVHPPTYMWLVAGGALGDGRTCSRTCFTDTAPTYASCMHVTMREGLCR